MEKLIFGSLFLNYFTAVQALNHFGFTTASILVFAVPFAYLALEMVRITFKKD